MPNNNAIYDNGAYPVDEHITRRGSDWLFAVCAIMGFSALAFLAWMQTKPKSDRIFHYLAAAICGTACIAYYAIGSNLGYASIPVEFHRGAAVVAGNTRQVFYARYIDWFITTPLLLLDLLLTAGVSWSTIMWVIWLDWAMIVTGLMGALVTSGYKWGFFVAGCLALFGIMWNTLYVARLEAAAIGSDINRMFLVLSAYLIVLWTLYPVCWGLAEGGNVIASDSEAIFYGVLDVLAKPVFEFAILWSHRKVDLARLGLTGRGRWSVTSMPGGQRTGPPMGAVPISNA